MSLMISFAKYVLSLYYFLLLIYALLSWLPGSYDSLIGRWVCFFVDPILRPLRRLNLQFGGLDVTVLVAILGIQGLSRWLEVLLV